MSWLSGPGLFTRCVLMIATTGPAKGSAHFKTGDIKNKNKQKLEGRGITETCSLTLTGALFPNPLSQTSDTLKEEDLKTEDLPCKYSYSLGQLWFKFFGLNSSHSPSLELGVG